VAGDHGLRKLAIGMVAAGMALALLAPPAAHAASSCANVTYRPGPSGHKMRVRFGLIGPVSCATAHALSRRYFHKFTNGGCAPGGNFCVLQLGPWACSIFFATEIQETGGAFGGCYRAKPTRAQFRWYPAGQRRKALHADGILSPDLKVWCSLATGQTFCVTAGPGVEHGGHVDRQGNVTTCNEAVCTQNWDPGATPLVAGDRTEAHGYRCTATRGGIECIRTSGPGTGQGFFVSPTGATTVTPGR
jgi:hypothetical protein